jgi:DNA-binding CsgD family transcriptional regulator
MSVDPTGPGTTLVGRAAETAAIGRLLTQAREGRSGVLLLRGEAGVGKSALLEHAADEAEGFTVLRGSGVEGESELAYAALHQILRPVVDRIDHLPGPQADALRAAFALTNDTVEERFRVSLGVLGLLSEAAENGPVLCLVDDVQWLDRASSDALLFAARRLEAEAVAMLFAARDDSNLRFDARGLSELRLSALTVADARRVLLDLVGPRPGPGIAEWVLENANGNPLALMELPRNMTADQLSGKSALVALPATSVEQVYLERVERLPDETRRLLVLAACEETGSRATVERAAAELGLDMSALSAAEADGLVLVDSEGLRFRHPLVRSAIYRAARFTERESAHRALASASAAEGNEDRAVWHLAAATVGADESVAQALEATAERARVRSGHTAAASALERAAALSPDSEARGRRHLAAAGAAWAAGQPERALTSIDRAVPDVTDLEPQMEAEGLRGVIEWRCGSPPEACSTLLRAARRLAETTPNRALHMLADAAVAGWDAGAQDRLVEIARAVASLRLDPVHEDATLSEVLLVSVSATEAPRRRDTMPLLTAVSRSQGWTDARLLIWAAIAAELAGEHELEVSLLDRAASQARTSGAVDTLTVVLESMAVQGFLAGDFNVAAEATEGLRLAQEAGLLNAANLHRSVLAWLAAVQGREEECRALSGAVIEEAGLRGHAIACSIAEWAAALLELGQGHQEEAARRLGRLAGAAPGYAHPFYVLSSAPDLVEAYVRTGRPDAARAAYAPLERFAGSDGPAWAGALAARCRALLADDSTAEAEFVAALRIHDMNGNPFDRARTRLLYGEWLRRERRRTDAREQLRSALSGFETLRADPWAERARVELRATGETAQRRDPTSLEDLTPQELQIARLVAEGSSNREVAAHLFLSPRTVEYHLHKVFTKLGIASRAELIRHGVVSTREAAMA